MAGGSNITRREAVGLAGGAALGAGLAPMTVASTPPVRRPRPDSEPPSLLYPHESSTRSVRDLSGLWRFALDRDDAGEARNWPNGVPGSRCIPVPCSWNDLFDDASNYFGCAWYETSFHCDAAWAGKRIHLRFGSAVYRAKVWLNGALLGEHLGGHLPFAFDATSVIRFEDSNRLVVMVENKLRVDRVPSAPDPRLHYTQEDFPQTAYDFFPYSGLHRQVWLMALPHAHIRDVTVVTRRPGATTQLDVAVTTNDDWSGRALVELSGGAEPARAALEIHDGRGRLSLNLPDARLWSPTDPFLHRLTIRLQGAAATLDEYSFKVGLRTIEVSGERLLLNGEPIHLRGFGKHEDFVLHGRGLDLAALVRDFELLEWIGANSFRTSHYPYSEETMMLADEYGFLVIAETPGVSLAFSDPDEVIEARKVQLAADLRDLIGRDKNHACVILWSLANEPLTRPFHTSDPAAPDAVEKGTRFFTDIFAEAHALDETRPAALVSLQNGPVEWVGLGDVICTNSYNGWYAVSGRLHAAAATLDREIQALHARCGAKPIIVTEFGADSMTGMHASPAVMWTEDYQSALISMYLGVLARHPYVVGTYPWAFADFRTAQSIMRVGSLNLKGVFTRDRRPKLAARTLRELWTGEKATDWQS